jgi:hypothetical protein
MAQLEGKLDTVLSLLQSVANSDSSAALHSLLNQTGISSQERLPLLGAGPTPYSLSPTSAAHSTDGAVVPTSTVGSPPLTSSSCSPASVHPTHTHTHEPSAPEAERYLADFRSRMLPYLPFIHLAPDLTAEQLRQERPFFLRAVVAVSSTSIRHKVEYGKELKNMLAQHCLVENRSSLDLLLGLLTYIAWGSDQFLTKSETLSRLMMMAMSMVYDLGLNKPLPPDEHMIGPFVPDFQCPLRVTSLETGQPLLERQRAALACFLLSSMCVPCLSIATGG